MRGLFWNYSNSLFTFHLKLLFCSYLLHSPSWLQNVTWQLRVSPRNMMMVEDRDGVLDDATETDAQPHRNNSG